MTHYLVSIELHRALVDFLPLPSHYVTTILIFLYNPVVRDCWSLVNGGRLSVLGQNHWPQILTLYFHVGHCIFQILELYHYIPENIIVGCNLFFMVTQNTLEIIPVKLNIYIKPTPKLTKPQDTTSSTTILCKIQQYCLILYPVPKQSEQ
jgi:hypothetical protein